MSDAKNRLEEIALRRAQLADELAAHEAELADAEQLASAERALADDEAVTAAVRTHGSKRIRVLKTDAGVVIVKRPHQALYKRFQDAEEASSEEFDKLVRPCLVYPDSAGFDRILEEQPGALMRAANAVCALAGAKAKEVQGK